jgi:SAM-dependent methyltransferase
MKNKDQWRPTKFVYKNGALRASRDTTEVAIGSRLTSDIVASYYDRHIRTFAHGKLLDLGCGQVPLFAAYRDFITDNVCVDWTKSVHVAEHLDHACDLNGPLPFSDGEFDTILLSDVLEHVAEPHHLWNEMTRVMAADGVLLMNVPFIYWLHEQPYDFYRYTEFALRRFVDLSALKLVELSATGGVPEIMADIFAKNIVLLPYIGKLLAVMAQATVAGLLTTRLGRAISDRTAKAFPLGYFLVASKR